MYCAGLMVRLLLMVSKICPSCQTEFGVKIHADEFHSSLTEFPHPFRISFCKHNITIWRATHTCKILLWTSYGLINTWNQSNTMLLAFSPFHQLCYHFTALLPHWVMSWISVATDIVVLVRKSLADTGFPGGGRQPKTYYLARFLPKTAWTWKKLDRVGGVHPWHPATPPPIR